MIDSEYGTAADEDRADASQDRPLVRSGCRTRWTVRVDPESKVDQHPSLPTTLNAHTLNRIGSRHLDYRTCANRTRGAGAATGHASRARARVTRRASSNQARSGASSAARQTIGRGPTSGPQRTLRCDTVAVRLAQRLRDLDNRVFWPPATRPFAIPCRYGYLPWQRWSYIAVAIIWAAAASVDHEPLQVAAAAVAGLGAVVAWTRPLTDLTEAGITWRTRPFRRRCVTWSQVADVGPGTGLSLGAVVLRLTDGSTATLPGVPQDHIPALRHWRPGPAEPAKPQ